MSILLYLEKNWRSSYFSIIQIYENHVRINKEIFLTKEDIMIYVWFFIFEAMI